MNKSPLTYFKPEEIVGLDSDFVSKLILARKRAGVPFIITSGFRSIKDNEQVMGVSRSAHTKGLAVDLRVQDSRTKFKIVKSLIFEGFTRIGVYDKHIHVDADSTLHQEVLWVGVSH